MVTAASCDGATYRQRGQSTKSSPLRWHWPRRSTTASKGGGARVPVLGGSATPVPNLSRGAILGCLQCSRIKSAATLRNHELVPNPHVQAVSRNSSEHVGHGGEAASTHCAVPETTPSAPAMELLHMVHGEPEHHAPSSCHASSAADNRSRRLLPDTEAGPSPSRSVKRSVKASPAHSAFHWPWHGPHDDPDESGAHVQLLAVDFPPVSWHCNFVLLHSKFSGPQN